MIAVPLARATEVTRHPKRPPVASNGIDDKAADLRCRLRRNGQHFFGVFDGRLEIVVIQRPDARLLTGTVPRQAMRTVRQLHDTDGGAAHHLLCHNRHDLETFKEISHRKNPFRHFSLP